MFMKKCLFTAVSKGGWRTSIGVCADGNIEFDSGSGSCVNVTAKDLRKALREHKKYTQSLTTIELERTK